MSLKGPTPEDERKLHAEINQIVNQRFLLTTLALTLFGVLTAWMVPKDGAHDADIGPFPFAISIVISVLLFSIYFWSHMLKTMMRVLTSYLAETGKSGWEVDWREFRQDGYSAHTKPQTIIFLVLITMSTIFPFVLSLVFSLKIISVVVPFIAVLLGVIAGLLIYLMGFKNLFDEEVSSLRRWKKLAHQAKGDREQS
jgi:hypothetical protein